MFVTDVVELGEPDGGLSGAADVGLYVVVGGLAHLPFEPLNDKESVGELLYLEVDGRVVDSVSDELGADGFFVLFALAVPGMCGTVDLRRLSA